MEILGGCCSSERGTHELLSDLFRFQCEYGQRSTSLEGQSKTSMPTPLSLMESTQFVDTRLPIANHRAVLLPESERPVVLICGGLSKNDTALSKAIVYTERGFQEVATSPMRVALTRHSANVYRNAVWIFESGTLSCITIPEQYCSTRRRRQIAAAPSSPPLHVVVDEQDNDTSPEGAHVHGDATDEKGDIEGRSTGHSTTTTWKWTIANDAGPSIGHHAAVVYKDSLYVYGGSHELGQPALKELWRYDFLTQKWHMLKNADRGLVGHSAVVLDDKIFYFGGMNHKQRTQNCLLCYSIAQDAWYSVKPLVGTIPTPRALHACVSLFPHESSFLVHGGHARDEDIYQFSLSTTQRYRHAPPSDQTPVVHPSFALLGGAEKDFILHMYQLHPSGRAEVISSWLASLYASATPSPKVAPHISKAVYPSAQPVADASTLLATLERDLAAWQSKAAKSRGGAPDDILRALQEVFRKNIDALTKRYEAFTTLVDSEELDDIFQRAVEGAVFSRIGDHADELYQQACLDEDQELFHKLSLFATLPSTSFEVDLPQAFVSRTTFVRQPNEHLTAFLSAPLPSDKLRAIIILVQELSAPEPKPAPPAATAPLATPKPTLKTTASLSRIASSPCLLPSAQLSSAAYEPPAAHTPSAEDLVAKLAIAIALHLIDLPCTHILAQTMFVSDFVSDATHLGLGGYAIASFRFAMARLTSIRRTDQGSDESGLEEDYL